MLHSEDVKVIDRFLLEADNLFPNKDSKKKKKSDDGDEEDEEDQDEPMSSKSDQEGEGKGDKEADDDSDKDASSDSFGASSSSGDGDDDAESGSKSPEDVLAELQKEAGSAGSSSTSPDVDGEEEDDDRPFVPTKNQSDSEFGRVGKDDPEDSLSSLGRIRDTDQDSDGDLDAFATIDDFLQPPDEEEIKQRIAKELAPVLNSISKARTLVDRYRTVLPGNGDNLSRCFDNIISQIDSARGMLKPNDADDDLTPSDLGAAFLARQQGMMY